MSRGAVRCNFSCRPYFFPRSYRILRITARHAYRYLKWRTTDLGKEIKMINDDAAPTVPESEPSAEPTPKMAQEPVPEPEQPEQPAEVAEEKSQAQAT